MTKKERKQFTEKDKEVDKIIDSENESEKKSSEKEESIFFWSRKEREKLAKQKVRGESKKKKRKVQKVVEREGKSDAGDRDFEPEREELEK